MPRRGRKRKRSPENERAQPAEKRRKSPSEGEDHDDEGSDHERSDDKDRDADEEGEDQGSEKRSDEQMEEMEDDDFLDEFKNKVTKLTQEYGLGTVFLTPTKFQSFADILLKKFFTDYMPLITASTTLALMTTPAAKLAENVLGAARQDLVEKMGEKVLTLPDEDLEEQMLKVLQERLEETDVFEGLFASSIEDLIRNDRRHFSRAAFSRIKKLLREDVKRKLKAQGEKLQRESSRLHRRNTQRAAREKARISEQEKRKRKRKATRLKN